MSKARDIADLGSNDVLETSSTGLDVTGTVTADGLTVDGATSTDGILVQNPLSGSFYNANIEFRRDTTLAGAKIQTERNSTGGVGLSFNYTANNTAETSGTYSKAMQIANNGDVSFYEDTGTTAKMVWDASAESLGIGTSSPWESLSLPFDKKISLGSATYPFSISRASAGELITTISDGYDSSNSRIDFVMREGSASENTALSITGAGNVNVNGALTEDVDHWESGGSPSVVNSSVATGSYYHKTGWWSIARVSLNNPGAGGTRYIHLKTNLVSGSRMLKFKLEGYAYNLKNVDTKFGLYMYSGSQILNKSIESSGPFVTFYDAYKSSDFKLVIVIDLGNSNYTSAQARLYVQDGFDGNYGGSSIDIESMTRTNSTSAQY